MGMHEELIQPAQEIVALAEALLADGKLTEAQQQFVHVFISNAKRLINNVNALSDTATLHLKSPEELSDIRHDLRSPLTNIVGYSEIFLQGIEGELSDWQREQIRKIKMMGQQLSERISELVRPNKE
jgi:signal transduction histidine kinase